MGWSLSVSMGSYDDFSPAFSRIRLIIQKSNWCRYSGINILATEFILKDSHRMYQTPW
jgi:hypothetical protein